MLAHVGPRPLGPDGQPLEICHGKAGKLVNCVAGEPALRHGGGEPGGPVRETAFPLVTGVACVVGGVAAATVTTGRGTLRRPGAPAN